MHTSSHTAGTVEQRKQLLELHGPYLSVLIRNPEHNGKALEFFSKKGFAPFVEQDGLIDTGATSVLLGREIAENLGLRQTGNTTMRGVNRSADALIYAGMIEVPQLDYSITLPVLSPRRGTFGSDLLLGRSFLKGFIVTYDGPTGMFTITTPIADYSVQQSQSEHSDIY